MMEKLQNLEGELSKKEDESNKYKRIAKREQNEQNERNNSQFIPGGYIHTISDDDNNITGLKRFSTFNSTRSEGLSKDKVDFNTKIIGNLMEIVTNLMKNIQEQKDEIKGQRSYIEEVDKALVVVEKKQNILVDDLQFQQNVINENSQDFENHK